MASFTLSIVGNAIGGPIGGAIGSMVGGLIDNVLFPVSKTPPPAITSSTFGQPIPLAWGPKVALPGNMIWTSGWRSAGGKNSKQASKSGQPPPQVCDACFCFGRGPWATSWLRKLYANGNLIFDADRASVEPTPDAYGAVTWPHDGGTHKDFDTLTVYPGNGIAIPDPTIEAALGVGQTPAYRGHPNIVIRSLQGTPFGNAVPTLRAICRVDLSVTLQQIVDDICDASGVDSAAMVSSGRLTQTVDGYAITGQTDGASAIQPLALVYNFDAAEVAGDLRFQPRGDPGLVLIEYDMLAAHPYGDAQPDAFAWPRETQGKLPRMASITFNDPAMDLNQNTQYAIRETGSSSSNISTSVALTLTADVAKRVADRILWEPWMGRQGFEQGATTDRLFFLESGRNYYMQTPSPAGPELIRLTQKDRGVNGVTEFQAKRDASAIYVSSAPGADANALANELGLGGPVNPPVFIEPPSTFPGLNSNQATLFIALSGGDGTTANDAWGGCDVYWASSDVTADYTYAGSQIGVSCMGKLTAVLPTYGGSNPDVTAGHILKVTTLESGGEPLPASALDASVAQVPYFVGGEWMTGETVTADGGDVYEITRLWRGLLETSPASHAIGAAFVRVDQYVFKFALPAGYVGQPLYFRFVSAGEQLAGATTYPFTPGGTGYGGGTNGVPTTPTAPVAGTSPSGGNHIAWTAPPVTDNVDSVSILRAPGPSGSIGSATLVGTAAGTATEFVDLTGVQGSDYTYFVVFNNVVGASTPSTGDDVTTTANANLWGFGWVKSMTAITPSAAFAFSFKGEAWTMPAGLPTAHCDLVGGSGPTAQTDFDIRIVGGVSKGTMRFAAAATSATFIFAADVNLSATDQAEIVPPSNLNGMSGVMVGNIQGPRA